MFQLHPQPVEHAIKLVMEQVYCTRNEARDALERNQGDIVDAVLELNPTGEKSKPWFF